MCVNFAPQGELKETFYSTEVINFLKLFYIFTHFDKGLRNPTALCFALKMHLSFREENDLFQDQCLSLI